MTNSTSPLQTWLMNGVSKSPIVSSISAFFLLIFAYRYLSSRSRLPLPPGPRGLPFLGYALSMPKAFEWKHYRDLCTEAGSDIIHFTALGQDIVVIDKYETAIELLEKRSGIYSSRPNMPMMELMGNWQERQFALSPYGDRWRRNRRLFHNILNEHTNSRFYPLIQRNTTRLLLSLLDDPGNFMSHIHTVTGSSVLELAYGLKFDSPNDPRCIQLEANSEEVVRAANPAVFLVNIFPILRFVPAWFPGAGFQRYAKKWAEIAKEVVEGTYRDAKKMIYEEGNTEPSLVFDSLEAAIATGTLNKEEEECIMIVAHSLTGAGTDTSTAALQTFVLLMTLHPEIQKRAQDEIQRICRPGHLLSYEDKDSYPYFNALVMEFFRYASLTPMALPHTVQGDDVSEGYRIPGGSIVLPNVWSMLRNEEVYPDPDTFNLERFLKNGEIDPNVRSPYEVVFGFGRRACPGKHLALMAFWSNAASILATFNMSRPNFDSEHEPEYKSGLVIHPVPFKCIFEPRSEEAGKLIRESHSVHL